MIFHLENEYKKSMETNIILITDMIMISSQFYMLSTSAIDRNHTACDN